MQPDKMKNKPTIRHEYNTDLLFAERKINYNKFVEIRNDGEHEKWDEISYVAQSPFFLHSLLMNLKVEHKLRVFKELNEFSFEDIKKLGFGGSIHSFFKFDPEQIRDRSLTEKRARLAIVLDIPVVFTLKDYPTTEERFSYNFIEYREFSETISFYDLKNRIKRPRERAISTYRFEKSFKKDELYNLLTETVFCRLDLRKSFFVIELHPRSVLDIDLSAVRKMIEIFDHQVIRVIAYIPPLRDSYKVCLIGTYIKEQQSEANNYAEEILLKKEGVQLAPVNFNLDLIIPN